MINFLGLILALLPTYLIRFHILGFPTTLLETLLVVFLLVTALKTRKDFSSIKSLGRINWAAGMFVLAGLISTLVSPDKTHALGQLKAFIIEPILFFYATILIIKAEQDKNQALRWLFGSGVLISLFGFVQYYTFLNLPIQFWGTGGEVERITSVFDYPNALALFLAPVFIFFASLFVRSYPLYKKSWVMPVGLITMLVALIMTFSRGAWIAIAAALLFLFLKRFSWKQTLIPALIIIIILLSVPPILERVRIGISDPSSHARLDLMKVGANKILSSPFLGNGLAGFPNTLKQANFNGEILNYPHNIILNFWLELGLLGAITLAWIIFLSLGQYKKHPSTLKFAAGMFILTLLIHGLVDVPYFKNDLSVLFWFMIAVCYL